MYSFLRILIFSVLLCFSNSLCALVGGEKVAQGEFPWMVGFLNLDRSDVFCGGTLIAPRIVLTAAHCLESRDENFVAIVNRSHYLSEQGEQIGIQSVHLHPFYDNNPLNPTRYANDLAIVVLEKDASVTPVPIFTGQLEVGENVTVLGWGERERRPVRSLFPESGDSATELDEQDNDQLRKIEVPVLSELVCRSGRNEGLIVPTMVCAGALGDKGHCNRDSGGPMVVQRDNTWSVAGVVIFSGGCADASAPDVYARVSEFSAWISIFNKGAATSVTEGTFDNVEGRDYWVKGQDRENALYLHRGFNAYLTKIDPLKLNRIEGDFRGNYVDDFNHDGILDWYFYFSDPGQGVIFYNQGNLKFTGQSAFF